MKLILILIPFLIPINAEVLHKDRYLQLDKNGIISGLPIEFCPATYDKYGKILMIHDKKVVFPECLKKYFDEPYNSKLILSASWYHSKTILPYYIHFNIIDKNANYNLSILFDLKTLDLLYINQKSEEGDVTNFKTLELDSACLLEYKSGIKDIEKVKK